MSNVSATLFTKDIADKLAAFYGRGKSNKDSDIDGNAIAAGGLATGGMTLAAGSARKALNTMSTLDSEEGRQLKDKIFAKANKMGIGTYTTPQVTPELLAMQPGGGSFQVSQKYLNRPDMQEYLKKIGVKDAKTGFIQSVSRGDISAHEFGHALHTQGKGGSKVATALHKIYQHPSGVFNPQGSRALGIGGLAAMGMGLYSGYNAANGEDSVLNKLAPAAIPAALSVPAVGSEATASIRGYKELKKLGASQKYLKGARRNLLAAIGTYAAAPVLMSGIGYTGRWLGKRNANAQNDKASYWNLPAYVQDKLSSWSDDDETTLNALHKLRGE